MSLQNEIDKLKTLQESFNELSSKVLDTQAVLTELNHGKQEIANAINKKGGNADNNDTLLQLSQKIESIQTVEKRFDNIDHLYYITGSHYSAMYYIQQYYNELFPTSQCVVVPSGSTISIIGVADRMITKEEEVVNASGDYYVEGDETGFGFVLLQYSTRNIAPVICDNLIYSYAAYGAKMIIESTYSQNLLSVFIESSDITIADNSFNNTYIADVCFKNCQTTLGKNVFAGTTIKYANIDVNSLGTGLFDNNTNIVALTINKLGSINISGMLKNCTASLKSVIMPDLVSFSSDHMLTDAKLLTTLSLPNLATISSSGWGGFCRACTGLTKIDMPKLTSISGQGVFINCSNVTSVNLPLLNKCMSGFEGLKITELTLPNATVVNNAFHSNSILKKVSLPKATNIDWAFKSCVEIEDVYAPNAVSFSEYNEEGKRSFSNSGNLINITTGYKFNKNIYLHWSPSIVLADTKKTAILNENIRKNIINNMPDMTSSPKTITFSQALRDKLEQSTEDALFAKGWNIAPTKTVTE